MMWHFARMRALVAVATVAALAASVVASTAAAAGRGGKPIVIGASLSLSGDFSADGQAFKRGYELWASDVNSHGGLLGRQVKLDIVSDSSSPAQVVTNYQKLINADHVDMLAGPFSTLLTVPSSKIANRYGYAMVEGAGGGPQAFANGLHNLFAVSLPVANNLVTFAKWIAAMPASRRPKTAAYPTSNDPFTEPQVVIAQKILKAAGVKTVYSKVFPAEVTDYTPIATAVVASKADIVLLGSVDVPTVSSFVHTFVQQHYSPKAFIATSGPDQGAAFVKAVGAANTDGILVPNGWFPGYANAASKKMVKEYVAKYGGAPADVNADVAEGYSVGQVIAQAVTATKGVDQKKIIAYLHSGVTLQSVQGAVKFNSLGENIAAKPFAFQWQPKGAFVQVLPTGATGSVKIEYPKPAWGK